MISLIKRPLALSLMISMSYLLFGLDESHAMPGFARKYDAPCSSCHIAFPKLNDFGIAFKQRGYRMEDEGPGKPVWKLKAIPVGGMAQVAYESKNDEAASPQQMSEANVTGVEFFFGGVLGPNISFFGDFGADVAAGESLTPDLAFIVFNDLLSDSRLNLKVGGFDVDMPFLSDPRSITLAPYLARISADGEEGVSLGKRGLEVNGYLSDTRTRYAIGLTNSADLEGTTNTLRAIHAWVTQSFELMGYSHKVGVMLSLDRNGVKSAGTDDGTQAYGIVLDLHHGLSGLILAYHQYTGGVSEGDIDINSFLAELLHSFSENLVAVARLDFQDSDTDAEKSQYTAGLSYLFLPNVKGQAEASLLDETNTAGMETQVQTVTFALSFGF